ncbi:MAG: hypothetical protein Q4G26_02980 [Paracoccus sp. (in: a-proteobacteria)]|nr:hypothetical protein [Paracoccus sp. (in: a-proteobacteria)]
MSKHLTPALSVLVLLAFAAPGMAREARCEIGIGGERIEGACDFRARKGGSFDITMNDGRSFAGATRLSLDVLRPGIGEIRSDGQSLGAANRSARDPACWIGQAVTICVRAAETARSTTRAGFSQPGDLPLVIRGRCHMDGCWWVRAETVEQIGTGSAAIPGSRLRVRMSHMSAHLQEDGPDYADLATPDSDAWDEASHTQFFCSMKRPAFLDDTQGWLLLDPASVGGASEGMTNIYLTLCHADAYRNGDPYEAGRKLGYVSAGNAGQSYPTFGRLTAP